MADYNSDRTGSNIDAVLDKADNLTQAAVGVGGNVGIGTASPSAKLDIAGETRIYPTSGTAILRFGSSGAEKGKISADTSRNLIFEAGGTERARIDSSGNLLVGTTSSPTGSGQIVANNGVYLGGTGAANKLDDYEEGTFTPDIYGDITAGTRAYTTQLARYVKLGSLVYIEGNILLNSWSGGEGNLTFALPFSGLADGIINVQRLQNMNTNPTTAHNISILVAGSHHGFFYYNTNLQTTHNALSFGDFASDTAFRFSGCYYTND